MYISSILPTTNSMNLPKMIHRVPLPAALHYLATKNTAPLYGLLSSVNPSYFSAMTTKFCYAEDNLHHRRASHCFYGCLCRHTHTPLLAPAPAPPVLKPAPPSTPLLRKQIFKAPTQSPIRSVIDSIAADGALTQAVQNSVQTTAAHMPELFKGIQSPAAAIKQPLTLIENEAAVKAITAPVRSISSLKRLLPVSVPPTLSRIREHWENWWRRERVNKTAEASLLYREVDALIVEGSYFIEKASERPSIDHFRFSVVSPCLRVAD